MIVTLRALEQEEHTLSVFKELNLEVNNFPISKLIYDEPALERLYVDLQGVDAVVLTSINALRPMANKLDKDVRLFIVGANTAEFAREKGMKNIIISENVNELTGKLVKAHAVSQLNKIVYPSAEIIRSDFKSLSEDYGISVIRHIIYKFQYQATLPRQLCDELLNSDSLDFFIFSYENCKQFLKLVSSADLNHRLSNCRFFLISEAIANLFNNVKIAKLYCADRANIIDLINLYKKC
jgi:uroporphyrinogen-III synthase